MTLLQSKSSLIIIDSLYLHNVRSWPGLVVVVHVHLCQYYITITTLSSYSGSQPQAPGYRWSWSTCSTTSRHPPSWHKMQLQLDQLGVAPVAGVNAANSLLRLIHPGNCKNVAYLYGKEPALPVLLWKVNYTIINFLKYFYNLNWFVVWCSAKERTRG